VRRGLALIGNDQTACVLPTRTAGACLYWKSNPCSHAKGLRTVSDWRISMIAFCGILVTPTLPRYTASTVQTPHALNGKWDHRRGRPIYLPIRVPFYFLPDLDAVCASALPAAVLLALLVRPSRNTFEAAEAALGLVVLVAPPLFLPAMGLITSFHALCLSSYPQQKRPQGL
jgi:hypothetical protein